MYKNSILNFGTQESIFHFNNFINISMGIIKFKIFSFQTRIIEELFDLNIFLNEFI